MAPRLHPCPHPAAPHLPSSTEPRWRRPRRARAAAMVSGQGRMFHGLAAVVTSHRQASGSPFSKAQSAMGVTALPPKNRRAVVPNILCFASPQLLFRPRRAALRLCLPLRLRLANMRNNLPAVRQYLETFAILIYLKFPTLVEEQLIPIFHDNRMRQQQQTDPPFMGAGCPDKPSESIASSNTSIFDIPSPQSTWFYSAILDIVFSWKARRSMSLAVKPRYILKLLSVAAWVITYTYTSENPTGLARRIQSWLGDGRNQPSLYILAVVVYLAPNMLAATLVLFPAIRRALERSNKS